MSKSALLKSSLAKKYWMAFTGLFLCLFLVGHLIGNLQLITKVGEEGRRAFNEYAHFMQHNIFIKVMSYVTYISILFHAIDGLMLAVQNKKARPVQYAKNNANANSSSFARQMAVLGSIILIFIATHMVNFWAKMHFGGLNLHSVTTTESRVIGQDPTTGQQMERNFEISSYLTTKGDYLEYITFEPIDKLYVNFNTHAVEKEKKNAENIKVVDGTLLYDKKSGLQVAEGYKDLHSAVMAFFGKPANGVPASEFAVLWVIFYTLSMAVLSFHLMHGFSSAFQSLGIRHPRYTPFIGIFGKIFAVIVPAAFAIIPIAIYFKLI